MFHHAFDCSKNNSENIISTFHKIFSKNGDFSEVSTIYIGKHVYQKHIIGEEINIIMRIAQVEWCHLQNVVFSGNTLSYLDTISSRELINNTFYAVMESLVNCDCPSQKNKYITKTATLLKTFSTSVVHLSRLKDDLLLKLSILSINNVKDPIYQYFHIFLDIQYYLLLFDHICGLPEKTLEYRVTTIMEDLIIISKKNYKRDQPAFLCCCMRDLWLILQLFIEKFINNKELFWEIFNKLLEKEEPTFALWLLSYISKLETYNEQLSDEGNTSTRIKPNYILLELKLKILLLNANSHTITECFKTLEPLLCNFWLKNARIEVYQIIWDYFSKRLNISNKKPEQSMLDYNELLQTILSSPKDCSEDFEIFLGMLIVHLREYPSHWGKMKGRIYSQLGPNKIKDLNETGIVHVMLLFLSLSSINYNELSKKIISLLEHLPLEKRNTNVVWNMYAVFILTHVRDGHSLENIAPLMLQMLQDISSDQKSFHMIKEFISNFKHIINFSKNMQLHQWLLLNSWASRYMLICYYPDLNAMLTVLLYTLDKVKNSDSWPFWELAFKDYIYPSLKQLSKSSVAPAAIGQIAGNLCLLIPDIASESFIYFNSECIPPKISCMFLNVVFENYPTNFYLSPQQEYLVINSWIKICLLTTNLSEKLTNNILKLECFPVALRSHVRVSKDPIFAFIEFLGSDIKKHAHSNDIIKLCESSFGHIDKWLAPYLLQPDSETTVFCIYTYISLAFLHCGILLYDRNKSTSPLTKLVQLLLLPTTFLMGKPQHMFILNALKKTWHTFFEAIVKLNNLPDTFLERTLRDMIVKYMYHFPTTDSPFIKCFENTITAPVIFDKISNIYFTQHVKESDANILKIINIISNFVQSTTSLNLMKIIVNRILCGLFEVIIFHKQKYAAIDFVKIMTCSSLFPQIQMDINNSVLAVTEKHLAFNTINYFQLMSILTKYIPANIKSLLGDIKKQISNVERMRGVGFDRKLRELFEKLEKAVTS